MAKSRKQKKRTSVWTLLIWSVVFLFAGYGAFFLGMQLLSKYESYGAKVFSSEKAAPVMPKTIKRIDVPKPAPEVKKDIIDPKKVESYSDNDKRALDKLLE